MAHGGGVVAVVVVADIVVSFRGGTEVQLSPPGSVVFGRAGTDTIVGLDPHDRSISSRAGAVTWARSGWHVINLSRSHPLFIEVPGKRRFLLVHGQRFVLCDPVVDVVIEGRIRCHVITVTLPHLPVVAVAVDDGELVHTADGTLTDTQRLEEVGLNGIDRLVLVAMVSRRLKRFPHRGEHPLTYEEIATLLGTAFTPSGVRRRVDRIRDQFRKHEIYFEGPRACDDLADHLIEKQMLGSDDLDLLDAHLRDLREEPPAGSEDLREPGDDPGGEPADGRCDDPGGEGGP